MIALCFENSEISKVSILNFPEIREFQNGTKRWHTELALLEPLDITNHAHNDCRSCAYSPDLKSVETHFFFAAVTSKAVTSNVFLCYFHEYQLAVVAIDGQVRANPVQTGPTHTILLLRLFLLHG